LTQSGHARLPPWARYFFHSDDDFTWQGAIIARHQNNLFVLWNYRSFPLDRLPQTISEATLLVLLGRILEIDPTPQSSGELCAQLFQPGFSWQALVDLAVAHEVLPALVFALNERSLLPPVPSSLSDEARKTHVTNRLLAGYRQHLHRQADLKQQLETVLRALNREAITPILLKGALHLTLAQSEWHQARAMRDLDILVPEAEADEVNRILVSLGYHADPDPRPLDRHLPELRRAGHAGAIEIHTEALSFPARYALTTEEVFAQAEPRSFAGVTFRALPAEWHLLHGLAHHQLADRGHTRRMLAIKGLWEFSKVGAEITGQGWSTLMAHAENRDIVDVLSSWSIQSNQLFGLEVPQQLLTFDAGCKHADATFKRARSPYRLRQAMFAVDKLRFAFAPETLAFRYGAGGGTTAKSAFYHAVFLWRRRGQMARHWFGG
jgi:hypothetical protein